MGSLHAYGEITFILSEINAYAYEYKNPMLVEFKTTVRHYEGIMTPKMMRRTLVKWKQNLWDEWLAFKQKIAESNAIPSQQKSNSEFFAEREMMTFFEKSIEECMSYADTMIADIDYAKRKRGQIIEAAEVKITEMAKLRLQIDELQKKLSEETRIDKNKDSEISTLKQEVEKLSRRGNEHLTSFKGS
jgi:hypothetical protein